MPLGERVATVGPEAVVPSPKDQAYDATDDQVSVADAEKDDAFPAMPAAGAVRLLTAGPATSYAR